MTLSQQLLAKKTRPAVVADLVAVVKDEVKAKKGFSGTAIKAGYGAATKIVPDLVERVVRRLLPEFAAALDPFWIDFAAAGGGDFGAALDARGPEVATALLGVTDAKVEGSGREPIKKAYRALRGKADTHVQAALPRLGKALQKHATIA
ncbi:DUF6918 family protein [Nocardioides stalactiti]|uniref:DUF6918 family protein n=1 Tax=Nocardioides stalactiti TaxID=2755356 RepID=UPI0015FF7961|nr:hypothetical protein [Nocardioides stalactiti]